MNAGGTTPAQPAYACNGQLVARGHFYAIACDPRRSVAVEACAGAGKTWMLVSRMVRALLEGAAPHEILAITFTKKAAGEMRQRLEQWLRQFAGQSDAELRQELQQRGCTQEASAEQLATLRQLQRQLLQSGRGVQVHTFHGWFAALLRSAPLQALYTMGLPASYELLEDDGPALALVWPRFQAQVAADPAARADYLASVAALGRHQTQRALEAALAKRGEFALADAQGVVEASVQTFGQVFAALAQLSVPEDYLTQPAVQADLQAAARALGAASQPSFSAAGGRLEMALANADTAGVLDALLTQKGEPRKFSDKLAGIAAIRAAQQHLQLLQEAQLQHAAWLHQQRLTRLTRLALAQYGAIKRMHGWVDMGDLERAALTLMSDPVLSAWVQERLDARVRHLLIDEFQDTNPLQWQALKAWLDSYAGAGRAPSVFLVGDPKQSIYRFRRAEPQVFWAAQRFVREGLGGDLLACDHTRRNAPLITELVNQVMAPHMDGFRRHSTESCAPGQVLKLPRLERGAALAQLDAGGWRDSLSTPQQTPEETRKTLECRQAARWLASRFQAGTLQPREVMVLARRRASLGLMQAELAALHIGAQQPEKTDLGDSPEVQDLVALLDVLVSPRHDLALARALKSPLFGACDDDLVQLVLCQRALRSEGAPLPCWWQVLQQHSDALPAALQQAAVQLAQWQQWVETLTPHDALAAIYHHGDVLARYAASTPAAQRAPVLARLQALLASALALDGGRYSSAYALVRALRAGGLRAPVRAEDAGVRLLTVHGAKGLEAPLVLLLDCDGEAPQTPTMGVLVDWPGEARWPQRLVFLASEARPAACVRELLAAEHGERAREELNALYVALTRAQTHLVLSSVEPHRAHPDSWWLRLEALAEDVEAAPAALQPAAAALAPITLFSVPNWHLSRMDTGVVAINSEVIDSPESRIGQAMHRLLEWLPLQPGPAQPWTLLQQQAVAQEFALDLAQAAQALEAATRIAQGEGAWAWDARLVEWAGSEVALVAQGHTLRLDRLVRRRTAEGQGQWWVLDYKSAAQPQLQPQLCSQLRAYRAAVARAYPGAEVRAAFLSALGACIEID